MSDSTWSIADAAQRTGLTVHTIRYYERAGLLRGITRDGGGRRRFTDGDLEWLAFLRRLRVTGMPIRAMRRFASLRAAGPGTVPARLERLTEHLDEVLAQRRALDEAIVVIRRKLAYYRRLARRVDAD